MDLTGEDPIGEIHDLWSWDHDEAAGKVFRRKLNPEAPPGPPYVWVFDTDEDGNLFLRCINPD